MALRSIPASGEASSGNRSRWNRSKLRQRLADDLDGAGYGQYGHDRGYRDVRPAGAGAENAQGRGKHGDVRDGVVAGADPHRPAIRIAVAMEVKHQRAADIGGQG